MVVHLQLDFEPYKKKLACVHKLAATYPRTEAQRKLSIGQAPKGIGEKRLVSTCFTQLR